MTVQPISATRPPRTYGTLRLASAGAGKWVIAAEPHVIQTAKRLWRRGGGVTGKIYLDATPAAAVDLRWFLDRYPLEMTPADEYRLHEIADRHEESLLRVQDYLGHHVPPPAFALALPPRDYQAREAAVVLEQGHLLVADEVGLGKTISAIAAMADTRALPAVVVTLTHLPHQWAAEVRKFAPGLRVHVIRNGPLYPLDGSKPSAGQVTLPGFATPDVVITSYSKLAKWAQVLREFARYVVFDEVQELRRVGSQKYEAAAAIAHAPGVAYRMGCSATPIYNYGDEVFSVLNVLAPGSLGTWREFSSEWCTPIGNNRHKLRQPAAFGSWAREQGLMVRHTRVEVGRELPDVVVSVQEIGAEAHRLEEIEGRAAELARILMDSAAREKGEKLMAGGELDRILRQATGLAKAPYVAEFVRLLVESGERVLLAGWHHACYDLWAERLAPLRVGRYTGHETSAQKQLIAGAFIAGDLDVLMISLRAGAGLDGLQEAARVVVFGELDWSPGVHEQVIGRLHRDGQPDPVVAYYLVADSGSDPVVAQVLGVKKQQALGVVDPHAKEGDGQLLAGAQADRARQLAESWMARSQR